MASFLTFNTCLLDVRLFGKVRVYPAAPHIEERLQALPQALRDVGADVVCLQEVFRRPHREFLAESLEDFYPYTAGIRYPGRPLGTGLMVLSRHPLEKAAPAEFRAAFFEERLVIRMGMLDCILHLPDLGRCRVIVFHLAAGGLGGHPESPKAEALRACQIDELVARADASDPGLCLVIGDLNAGPEASAVNYRRMLEAGFIDATAGAPMTWEPGNPLIQGEVNETLPAQRIDHILVRREGALHCRIGPAARALDERCVALAGGEWIPLSDHYGLIAGIHAAG